jgi:hypothetical protein
MEMKLLKCKIILIMKCGLEMTHTNMGITE